ncbi:MAG: twin-arginine translocase TatA/TatE family subunit [Dehalococcoidia bacterium]|nr:MAG: twin-arginine translocase TatA/TatE family subunit [Dehalococcoidia bacterium]
MRPPGPLEIGLILVIILIVFGVGKLPQVGAAFGKGIRAFKRGQSDDEEEEEKPKKKPRRKKRAAKKVTKAKTEDKAETETEAKTEEKA